MSDALRMCVRANIDTRHEVAAAGPTGAEQGRGQIDNERLAFSAHLLPLVSAFVAHERTSKS